MWPDDWDVRHPLVTRWALGELVAAAVATHRSAKVRPFVEQVDRMKEEGAAQLREILAGIVPLGRMGQPEEVAALALLLATDQSGHETCA
ncbi:hypothetical protein ACFY8K_37310 [Streptomyces misionensis]|uniref:hypothetical protein n=1 Tax=Streptomyces misionensis TaxID=67331 RepID=UPI0036954CCF